jgi:ADP-ribosylglycohydrolase
VEGDVFIVKDQEVSFADTGLFNSDTLEDMVRLELSHRGLQGYDLGGFAERIVEASGDMHALWEVYGSLLKTSIESGYPYDEPNDLPSIKSLRPDGPRVMEYSLSDLQLSERILGALQGRIVGIILGRPVEGNSKEEIKLRLESSGDYPLNDYFRQFWTEGGIRKTSGYASFKSTSEGLGLHKAAEADDDINYVLLNLRLLEKFGSDFTTEHVGYNWLESCPVNWTWGPERTAYINLARFTEYGARWKSIDLDTLWKVTHYLHESSELIGAQIRADVFGYAAPGLPEIAAEWAYKDAALTHVKNGIYGEMLFAAIISAAFVAQDIRSAIEIGLSEIPAECRLSEAIRSTLRWWDETNDWESVYQRIAEKYNKYTPGGTINNACIIVNALLAGGNDFSQTMAVTIMQGQDTDCTGGTAGSIMGAYLGAGNIPTRWVQPFNDTFDSAIVGEGRNSITDTAKRISKLACAMVKSKRSIPFKWDQ